MNPQNELQTKKNKSLSIIKKCHCCGELSESQKELERCTKCNKSFLPLNYFGKVHAKNTAEYKNLFTDAYELSEEDLIKGLYVLW